VNGNRDNKTGIIVGDLETKWADRKNGVSVTEVWTTSNHLNGKIELENSFASNVFQGYLLMCVLIYWYVRVQ